MKKTLIGKIVLIATLFLIYFGFQKEQVQAAAPIARGIDVSMWQKNIDWNAVASEGISFAFIRFGNTQKGIDPYFTTKYKSQGTGLGLFMSKMIIEKSLDGQLSHKNTKDGSIFTIKLVL